MKTKSSPIKDKDKCIHCRGNLKIRNPKGYCDHLYYPEYCKVCQNAYKALNAPPIPQVTLIKETSDIKESWSNSKAYDIATNEVAEGMGDKQLKQFIRNLLSQQLTEIKEKIGKDLKLSSFKTSFARQRAIGKNELKKYLRKYIDDILKEIEE